MLLRWPQMMIDIRFPGCGGNPYTPALASHKVGDAHSKLRSRASANPKARYEYSLVFSVSGIYVMN